MILGAKWTEFQNNHFLPSIDRVMHVAFVVDIEAMEQIFYKNHVLFCQFHFTNAPYSPSFIQYCYVVLTTDSVTKKY